MERFVDPQIGRTLQGVHGRGRAVTSGTVTYVPSGGGGSSSSSSLPYAPAGNPGSSASLPRASFEEIYDKGHILARGACGVAFIVWERQNPKVQLVTKEICLMRSDEKRRREAIAESQLLRNLRHPNIVACLDVFEEVDMMYIVMEYANGGDLGRRIQAHKSESRKFSEPTIMKVFLQLCAALAYIHSQKILHRDLKPANIFMVGEGELSSCIVKLGDFGIAKMIEGTMGQANSTVGTPSYLSPEICKNNPYGVKADVWSLGVVLYELVCLKVPFQAGNLPAMALMICTSEPKPISEDYSKPLSELVMLLLQKEPSKRPLVATILQRPFVQGFSLEASKNSTSAESSPPTAPTPLTGSSPSSLQSTTSDIAPLLSISSAVYAFNVPPAVASSARASSPLPAAPQSTGTTLQPLRAQPPPTRTSRTAEIGVSRLPSCGPANRGRAERFNLVDELSSAGGGGSSSSTAVPSHIKEPRPSVDERPPPPPPRPVWDKGRSGLTPRTGLLASISTRSVSPNRCVSTSTTASPSTGVINDMPLPFPAVMLRSSGSAPSLPPLPRLMAPPRVVSRSRSVAGLHDAGRATVADGFQPGQRNSGSNVHLFRTTPLPVPRDTSDVASEGRDGRHIHPPQQPAPSQRQSIVRDENNIARLVPKLPSSIGSQVESRPLLRSAAAAAAAAAYGSCRTGMASEQHLMSVAASSVSREREFREAGRDVTNLTVSSSAASVAASLREGFQRELWGSDGREPRDSEARLASARLSVV